MSERIVNETSTKIKSNNKVIPTFDLSIDFKKAFLAILPLMLAQLLQRFSPIIDNHYIANLGTQALLIHNIQYSFVNLGQYIGGATAVSCLIFWKRAEYANNQGGIFYLHLGLCLCSCLLLALFSWIFSSSILSHFSVQPEYYSIATQYFKLGLLNMTLQAIYLALMGIVIAVNKEKLSFIFSITLLALNIFLDALIIHFFFNGQIAPQSISAPLLAIIFSNLTLVSISILVIFFILKTKIKKVNLSYFEEIFKIWTNELGGAFISAAYPIVYFFQLALIKTGGSLLVTYQLLIQLTAVFCVPILAAMPLALREASAHQDQIKSNFIPVWVRELTYFGFIPTQFLLTIFIIYPVFLIQAVFGYHTPTEHVSYIVIYLFASMIGQIGNMLTVSIRAKKNSHLVTIGYFISDVIVLVGGTQLLFILNIATPMTAGLVMLIYTCFYTLINLYFAMRK